MFLDLFDTVRTSFNHNSPESSSYNAVQAEVSLFYMMIMGYHPTLTETQLIDSNVILNIAQSKYKNYFFDLIKNGTIRVCLNPMIDSVQEHFINCMARGLDDDSQLYVFSAMPFLSDYDNQTRRLLQRKIIDSFNKGRYSFRGDGIKPEHADYISDIVRFIVELNVASEINSIKGQHYSITLDAAVNKVATNLKVNCQDKDLAGLLSKIQSNNFSNKRSAYYNFLKKTEEYHDKITVDKVRRIIDCCYNFAISTSVNDPEGARISIPNDCKDVISSLRAVVENLKIEENKIRFSHSNEFLTWENIANILAEIEIIQKEKQCNREEALQIFKVRQTRSPVSAVGKYIGINVLTLPFQFIPFADSIPDLIKGAFSDSIGEKLKKPSIAEIFSIAKTGPLKADIAKNALEYMSITINK